MNSPLSLKKFTPLGLLPSEFHKSVEEKVNISENEDKTKPGWAVNQEFTIFNFVK